MDFLKEEFIFIYFLIQALWHTKIECVLTQKETIVSGWKIRIKCNSQKMPYQGILWNKIVGTVSLLPPLIHLKDTYNLMLFSSQQHQHIYFGSTRIQFPLSGRAYIGTYENVSSSLEKFITRTSKNRADSTLWLCPVQIGWSIPPWETRNEEFLTRHLLV